MSFMQHQITNKQQWFEVDTTNGTEYIPHELIGYKRDSESATHPLTDKERETIISELSQYCEGTIQEWKTIFGYGARLSAPGYTDCTEWTVFETAEEAKQYLGETYPEDEENY